MALDLHFYAQTPSVLGFIPENDFKMNVHFQSPQLSDVTNWSIVGVSWTPATYYLFVGCF
jgi:hypothetical protein